MSSETISKQGVAEDELNFLKSKVSDLEIFVGTLRPQPTTDKAAALSTQRSFDMFWAELPKEMHELALRVQEATEKLKSIIL